MQAAFHLTDAVAEDSPHTVLVTRTAVEESGVAKDASLRTTEAIPVGTTFKGELHTDAVDGSLEDLAWRLSLTAIRAIGGSRSRGCGACLVEIKNETRTPGELLRSLHQHLQEESRHDADLSSLFPSQVALSQQTSLSDKPMVLRLRFYARTPICCPELPDKTNVISTGFSIPASAVQGAILNYLNAADPGLATALFGSPLFRAWPLHPCWNPVSKGKYQNRSRCRSA